MLAAKAAQGAGPLAPPPDGPFQAQLDPTVLEAINKAKAAAMGNNESVAKANAIAQAQMKAAQAAGMPKLVAPVRPGVLSVPGPGLVKAQGAVASMQASKPGMQVSKMGYWNGPQAASPSFGGLRPPSASSLSKMPTIHAKSPGSWVPPGKALIVPSKGASLAAASTKGGVVVPPHMSKMPMTVKAPAHAKASLAPSDDAVQAAADVASNGAAATPQVNVDTSMKEVSPALAALMSGLDF